jgi:hypothetical protein
MCGAIKEESVSSISGRFPAAAFPIRTTQSPLFTAFTVAIPELMLQASLALVKLALNRRNLKFGSNIRF